MISERSKNTGPKVHAFNTFFYPKLMKTGHASLRRWTKKVDLFAMDIVLIPIHLGMHWCLAVRNLIIYNHKIFLHLLHSLYTGGLHLSLTTLGFKRGWNTLLADQFLI